MDQAFDKCKGAFAIADDIQVYGNDSNPWHALAWSNVKD